MIFLARNELDNLHVPFLDENLLTNWASAFHLENFRSFETEWNSAWLEEEAESESKHKSFVAARSPSTRTQKITTLPRLACTATNVIEKLDKSGGSSAHRGITENVSRKIHQVPNDREMALDQSTAKIRKSRTSGQERNNSYLRFLSERTFNVSRGERYKVGSKCAALEDGFPSPVGFSLMR